MVIWRFHCTPCFCVCLRVFIIKCSLNERQKQYEEKKERKDLDMGIKGRESLENCFALFIPNPVICKEDEFLFQIGHTSLQRTLILFLSLE